MFQECTVKESLDSPFQEAIRRNMKESTGLHSFRANFWGCRRNSDCIELMHVSRVKSPTMGEGNDMKPKMDLGWYLLLDSDSYHLGEEREAWGVTWCRSETCKNYYRFSRSRLEPLVRASGGCSRPCNKDCT